MKTIKLVNRNQVIKLTHSGRRGPAGTITVGDVTTGSPDQSVTITNVGTSTDAILNFVIPQGVEGEKGDTPLAIQPEAPTDTDFLWVDTDDSAAFNGFTKNDLDLEFVDNTSDIDKPISTATQNALNSKQPIGNYATVTNLNDKADKASTYTKSEVDNKDNSVAIAAQSNLNDHINNNTNPHETSKAQVGLGSVPNVDATKRENHTGTQPISTIVNLQSELDSKALPSDIDFAISNLVDQAPETLNTLAELSEALGDNPDFATSTAQLIGTKADTTYVDEKDAIIAAAAQSNLLSSLDTKVDKTTGVDVVYSNNSNGIPSTIPFSSSTTAGSSIVQRTADGKIIAADGTADNHVATKKQMEVANAAHVSAVDPHPQYLNNTRGDSRYASLPYAVMAKSLYANLSTSYGYLGNVFANSVVKNDLTVYGNSTQSALPTPDAPIPIVSTTGNVTVRSDSKNLAYTNRTVGTPYTINGVTYVVNADGSVTANGTATSNSIFQLDTSNARSIRVTAGTAYAISGVPSTGSGTTFYVEAETLNDDGTMAYMGSFVTPGNVLTPTKSGWARVYVTVRNGYTANNLVFKPQLEVSNAVTTFEKNISSTQTLPLGSIQLRSLPNGIQDRIYKNDGNWYLEQNIGSFTLNGSESWSTDFDFMGSDGSYRYKVTSPVPYDTVVTFVNQAMSDRFRIIPGTRTFADNHMNFNIGANGVAYKLIFINTLTYTSLATFKAWLATVPTNVILKLETPIVTQITDNSLITSLESIRTYQGVTNITSSTQISGSYGLDLTTSISTKVDKSSLGGQVYITGDTAGTQTVMSRSLNATADTIAQRTSTGILRGATAVAATDLTPKAQMDAADALKVNKAGDTMTAALSNTETTGVAYRQTRGAKIIGSGTSASGNFAVYNFTDTAELFNAFANGSGISLGDAVGSPRVIHGTGFPNAVLSAPVGTIYIDRSVTNGASSWIKRSGNGNTGWQVLDADTGYRNIASLYRGDLTLGTNPKAVIRRVGNTVEIAFDFTATVSQYPTEQDLLSVTTLAGFNSYSGIWSRQLFMDADLTNGWALRPSGFKLSKVATIGSGTSSLIRLSVTYFTPNDWPTTLPGVAL